VMNGYRILVVEDDAASRDTLRRLFAHEGWVVSVAKTVTEAMTKLNPPPHCILLDLMLPDGDGEEVLRKVREDNLPTKVAVCTGMNDPVRLALVKGMDPAALFQKPIDFDEVYRACEDDTVFGIETGG
jgi:CheY-like chemotaxis protein